jgi:hypothetical protein
MKVRLLAFAPVSADGSQRPAGLVYHLWLENTGKEKLDGTLKLPKLFEGRPEGVRWAWKEPYEFELGLADGRPLGADTIKNGLPFSLKPGETLSVPLVLYMPGTPALEEIQQRGELAWFNDTWRYHRGLLGRMESKDNPWLAEFQERQVLQALGSLAVGPTGKLAGSNWGTYPATRQIWPKDTFYSALPIVSIDPSLAAPILDWFHENGVRQPGAIVAGGLNHSISLSISSLMLAGKYYDETGDKEFFRSRAAVAVGHVTDDRADHDAEQRGQREEHDGDERVRRALALEEELRDRDDRTFAEVNGEVSEQQPREEHDQPRHRVGEGAVGPEVA